MTTRLEHSDHILRAKTGETVLAVEPVRGVNMRAGGVLKYQIGARFRVRHASCDLLWCIDDEARSVTFDRVQMFSLDRHSVEEDHASKG